MWDLPRPRIEPVSPALAVRFFTAEPPGEPSTPVFLSGKSCGQWSQRATVHGVVKQSDATKFKKKKCKTHTLCGQEVEIEFLPARRNYYGK